MLYEKDEKYIQKISRNEKILTIFTPTYNRAYTIEKLYKSLKKQNDNRFVWLIVDDGSVDNTDEYIKKWKAENIIDIIYYYQENAGKSAAHNFAVEKCDTELFTCVDSDDYIVKGAVKKILNDYENIGKCIGMVYKRKHVDGKLISKWPSDLKESTLREAYGKYKAIGDTMLVYRTKILKRYEFPRFEGEKFVPESYLYDKLDQDGSLIFIHSALYVCEYLEDGYTRSMTKLIKNNPEGYLAYINQRLLLDSIVKDRLMDSIRYCAISISAGKHRIIRNSVYPVIAAIVFPAGYILYLKRYTNV